MPVDKFKKTIQTGSLEYFELNKTWSITRLLSRVILFIIRGIRLLKTLILGDGN